MQNNTKTTSWPSTSLLLGIALFLASLLIRLVFIEAPIQSDDTMYFQGASKYSLEFLKNADHHIYFRIGLIFPLMLCIKVFGYNLVAYYLFSISCYLSAVVSVYLFCLYSLNKFIASAAVLILSSSSFFLYQTSNIIPDTLCVSFLILSSLLFSISFSKDNKKYALIFFSAILGYLVFLIRMPNIVFLISLPLYELFVQKSIKKSLLYALLFLFFILLELLVFKFVTGEFLYRFSVINSNVQNWSANLPVLSIAEFFLKPLGNFCSTYNGAFLLLGGTLGTITAGFKRNWLVLSLFLGSFLVFAMYSYSFSSLEPLRRYLPLQARYILSFTAVLGICFAYFLNWSFAWAKTFFKQNGLFIFKIGILGVFLVLQLLELPAQLNGAVFFGNDAYFVADRMLQDKLRSKPTSFYGKVNEKVHLNQPALAYPKRDFALYPNFSRLHLKGLDLSQIPKPGNLLLYSKQRLKKTNKGIWEHKLSKESKAIDYLLNDHPNFSYILKGPDIILAKVLEKDFLWKRKYNLGSVPAGQSLWLSNAGSSIKGSAYGLKCFIPKNKVVYLYTFGSFSSPPAGFDKYLAEISSQDWIRFKFDYVFDKKPASLVMFFVEYSKRGRVCSHSYRFFPGQIKGSLDRNIKFHPGTVSYRIYLRVESRVKNILYCKDFGIYFKN